MAEKPEAGDSEDEVEDVYEVERIIDMRTEEGEVLYRVRWKNYSSDDDTWEPEAHLEDCREVLLGYKRALAEAKVTKDQDAKKCMKLPMKSDVFDADSDSDSDIDKPTDLHVKKKKKKKPREEEEEEAPPLKEKRKKKKDKRKEDFRPRPAPESDEEELSPPPTPGRGTKMSDSKKRFVDSDEEEEAPVPSKKHRKDKAKDGGKHGKKENGEEGKKKKKKKKDRRGDLESTEDEATAPLEEELSEGPSESQTDDTTTTEKSRADDKPKNKKSKSELKLQGIKDLLQDKKGKKLETSSPMLSASGLAKLKSLTSSKSQGRDEPTPTSDSSDTPAPAQVHKKAKGKSHEATPAPPKIPSSSSSSSSSSSGAGASTSKTVEESKVVVAGDKEPTASTNLFEKFLLNCEAKDRVPRKQMVHQPTPTENTKPPKLIGKIEKRTKPTKESPARKPEPDKSKHTDAFRPSQSPSAMETGDRAEAEEEPAQKSKFGGEDRREEAQRWERRTQEDDRRRRRREDSEPRLFIACDDNQDPLESADKSGTQFDKGQASLNLGMDLNLDWMTLEDFQKHLNGEDEILSAPPLSPSELRDAVKSGDYMSVKLALNSKEDYNLDQEDSSGMSLSMLAAAGGQDDILRLLIKKGVKVNGRQKNGTTALMHAAEKNFLTTVAILLEAGSYVNAPTLGGETALMKACKRGNADVVRLLLEYGADCNILSKHKNTAMYFAKVSNNLLVYDLIKDHINMLSSVAEDTIRAFFETRLALLEPVFPLACHRLCEGPDFSLEFGYKQSPHTPGEGSGILLFIFHANFLSEITARLCGPCSVHAVVLNDKFQLPIFLDSHFIYSFSPVPGINKLFIRLAESPTAKVKLLICAYRVQLQ
ncbi:M-phase phosphoprotein 8-like isoform X5 [Salvelinus namaycush]|uniref:M-phase phosphoprotein 8-like isoform X5 n=1 Tax=Salvelinus namaycush TaxID=8040 RepID=A0A8U1EQN5_SALNM|nr:M-phase phosphoprotein 8-like isoform X5 [Salvelinus namaycush]